MMASLDPVAREKFVAVISQLPQELFECRSSRLERSLIGFDKKARSIVLNYFASTAEYIELRTFAIDFDEGKRKLLESIGICIERNNLNLDPFTFSEFIKNQTGSTTIEPVADEISSPILRTDRITISGGQSDLYS